MKTTTQYANKRVKQYSVFLLFLLIFHNQSYGQQNPLDLFSEYEETQNQRELFIQEIIQLDSILQYDDYLNRITLFKPDKLAIQIENGIIKLDFAELFCKDYKALSGENKLPNIEKLRGNGKLSLYCRSIASEVDVLPKRTGNIQKDCKIYLDAIKKVINKNQRDLDGLTFEGYIQLEKSKNIVSDSQRFVFRKRFLQFLKEKYYVNIE